MINIRVNNKNYSITDELGEKKLVDFLREDLGFTGTKIGCEVGACGACTILVNKVKTKSCMFYVKDVTDNEVLTIEGLEKRTRSSRHLLMPGQFSADSVHREWFWLRTRCF